MPTAPRLRFAPSPTGSLHVGNARTALVNWLAARRAGGALVLRIEDTDAARSGAASEATILEDLAWMGLDWDEGPDVGGPRGPYRQSERGARYAEVVRRLVQDGHAYPDFESAEEIAARRDAARSAGSALRFRGQHRDRSPAEALQLLEGGGAAVRFKVPDRAVRFVDGLRGDTGLAAGEIGDFVIARADGTPTYNLAVVVDDHDMGIDTVVRGEDHLTNTPRQILLYEGLGWQPPHFTHLALVLGPDRSRLSKRHGATSVAEMRAGGILPAALCNFLALLGWSPPDEQEVLTVEQLREVWDLADLAPANAVFDETKLEWLNGQHLAALPPDELLGQAVPFLRGGGLPAVSSEAERAWLARAAVLVAVGRRRLTELPGPLGELLYPTPAALEKAAAQLRGDERAGAVLAGFARLSRAGALGTEERYLAGVAQVREATGAGGRALFHPLRLAISGQDTGPELKQLVPLLEAGAALALEPPVAGVAARIERVLGSAP